MKTKFFQVAAVVLLITGSCLHVNAADEKFEPYSKSEGVNIEIVNQQIDSIEYNIEKGKILSVINKIQHICMLKGDLNKLVNDMGITGYKETVDIITYNVPMDAGQAMRVSERSDSISSNMNHDVQIGITKNKLSYIVVCVDKKDKRYLMAYWDGVTNIKHEGIVESKSLKYNYSEIGVDITWPIIPQGLNYGEYTSLDDHNKINKFVGLINDYKNIITSLQEVACYEKDGGQYIGTIYDEQKSFRMSFWLSGETGVIEHFKVWSDDDEIQYKLYVQYNPLYMQERIDNKTFRSFRCDNGVVTSFRTME